MGLAASCPCSEVLTRTLTLTLTMTLTLTLTRTRTLQEHTSKLKTYVATLDARACHAAMKGGVLGIGCDDEQLIAATCTRTKAQLARTIKRYRALYERDLRADIKVSNPNPNPNPNPNRNPTLTLP